MVYDLMIMDRGFLLWIQNVLRTPLLNTFFIFVTSLGNVGAVWIGISVILFIPKKTRKIGAMCMMALIATVFVNNLILKNLVGRTRPYEVIGNLQLLVKQAKDFSFPSGHTSTAFASAYILYKELPKKYGISAMIFAGLMGFSRLYVGIHYPSDVLAGAVLGLLMAGLTRKVFYMWAAGDKMNSIKQMLYIEER